MKLCRERKGIAAECMIKKTNDVYEDPLNHWRDCVSACVSFLGNVSVNGISAAEGEAANQSRNQSRLNLFLGPNAFSYRSYATN
jgi:hypothetical protein